MLVVGNKVRTKSAPTIKAGCERIGWELHEHPCGVMFPSEMEEYCNREFKILQVVEDEEDGFYTYVLEDVGCWNWLGEWLYYMDSGVKLPEELFEI